MSETISGYYGTGITLISNPVTITGTIYGKPAEFYSNDVAVYAPAGVNWTVTNQGDIGGSTKYQQFVSVFGLVTEDGTTLSNAASGTIAGYRGGILALANLSVTNAGTIVAASVNPGILAYGPAYINNLATGEMSRVYVASSGTVLNAGYLEGVAVRSGLIDIETGGVVANGVELGGQGTIVDYGKISGGVFLNSGNNHGTNNSTLVLGAGGSITGPVWNFAGGDVIDFRGITASSAHLYVPARSYSTLSLYEGTQVVAALTLGGQFTSGEFSLTSDGAGGTDVVLGEELVNSDSGRLDLSAAFTSIASGVNVTSQYGGIVELYGAGWTVQNAGTINGSGLPVHNSSDGIGINLGNGTVTNLPGAVVKGNYAGVELGGGFLDNFGTIAATGTSATGAIVLAPSSINSVIQLETSSVLVGAIAGFVAGDVLNLAGVTADGAVFGGNVLTLTNHGSLAATVSLVGDFSATEFAVASFGSLGTQISLQPVDHVTASTNSLSLTAITTSIAAGVTLGNGLVNDGTDAMRGAVGRFWTVVNDGTVLAGGSATQCIALPDGVVINNQDGVIGGTSFDGVQAATIVNYGLIENGIFANGTSPHLVFNEAGGTMASIFGADTVLNAGTINGQINFSTASSRLIIDPGAVLIGSVTATESLTSAIGAIITSRNDNILEFAAGATTGTFTGIGESVAGFNTIAFDAGAHWLLTGNTVGLAAGQSITGFALGDTLQLDGFTFVSESFVSGEGLVLAGTSTSVTLDIQGSFSSNSFAVTTISTGTEIQAAPCFTAGTQIRTPGGEVAVEDLCPGDLVETAFAGPQRIKWIGRRDYDGRFIAGNHLALPVCIKAGAIADGIPSRDLFVSPDHAICEAGVLIHAWRLVNGVSITQGEAVERVSYIHIELDSHQIIFAEHCPTESFLDLDCRQRFQNASEFLGASGDVAPGQSCLPLLQSGFHLQNIQRRLAARAGLTDMAQSPGALRGNLDEFGPARLHGWAQDKENPEIPVCLEILSGGERLALVLANEFRADLRAAGIGSGCHGFSLPLPTGGAKGLKIRRAGDGAMLTLPAAIRAA